VQNFKITEKIVFLGKEKAIECANDEGKESAENEMDMNWRLNCVLS
jgi:hypothetical protein